ncbi:MAG: glycosyltransferase family 4 protein [Verrucomicrobiota bacterium]
MKLALCLEYPIDQFGGTEILVIELIKGLAAKHQIVLVSNETEDSAKKSSVGHLISQHIPWNPAQVSQERCRELAQKLAESKVDLIHFHLGGNYAWNVRAFSKSPIIAVSRTGIPCLSTNHGAFGITYGYCGEQRSVFIKAGLFLPAWLSKQYVLSKLRCEVAVSQNDYHALRRWYPLMRNKFRQIYHSRVHESALVPVLTERNKVILCVGTVGERKGQWILAEAWGRIARKHPDWKVVLIGRMGSDIFAEKVRGAIEREKLGGQLQFLGPQNDDEVNRWLREAAIFAMPSFQEGLGLSLQEALFEGCACVASRVGGVQNLIQHNQNGLLTEAGNVEQLASALDQLISDEALRKRFASRARQSVLDKEMTAEKMIGKYQDLYERLLKSHKPPFDQ